MKEVVNERMIEAMEEITERHHKEIDFLYKVIFIYKPPHYIGSWDFKM